MPTIKPKRAHISEIVQSFGGIGTSSTKKEHRVSDLDNFRILSDGSLKKRCGFKKKYAFGGAVRGFWEGFLAGSPISCAVVGSDVYVKQSGGFTKKLTLTSASNTVQFVHYHDHLYLLDGKQIYVFDMLSENFRASEGYAPLIGYGWNPTSLGSIHEPVNLFTNRMRVNYKNPNGTTAYTLPFYATSIDYMVADGRRITNYTFTPGDSMFFVEESYSWLEVGFTTSLNTQNREFVNSSLQGVCEHLNDKEYLFLFGSKSANYLFGTKEVDQQMMNACLAAYPLADPLYCTSSMQLAAGTVTNPITSIYKQRDRLLAFHANGALSLQIDDQNQLVSYPLLQGCGCTTKLSSLVVDEKLIILNPGGIFQLTSDASDPDLFSVTPISQAIPHVLTPSFTTNAMAWYDSAHEELWFHDRTTPEKIYVYHMRKQIWYTFSGFLPTFFLTYQGNIGFASENSIYLFDENKNTDDGIPITSKLKTGYLFADTPETLKRVFRMTLLAKCGQNETALVLHTENNSVPIQFSTLEKGDHPFFYNCHVASGRFRLLQIELTDTGEYRTHIYRLAVFANS